MYIYICIYNLGREGEVTNLVIPTNHATSFRGVSINIIPVDAIQDDLGGKVFNPRNT